MLHLWRRINLSVEITRRLALLEITRKETQPLKALVRSNDSEHQSAISTSVISTHKVKMPDNLDRAEPS